MDGFETAKRIRQTPWGRHTKIVAATGWGKTRIARGRQTRLRRTPREAVEIDAVLKLMELLRARPHSAGPEDLGLGRA
jgi:CheY-like chemotaxis protein